MWHRLPGVFPLIVLASLSSVSAYEWRSHNQMAVSARGIFLGGDRPAFPVDREEELQHFLDRYGRDLDTRAGNPCDAERDRTCVGTDEDHTEGRIEAVLDCFYVERNCVPTCTFDHFLPPLGWPVPALEADRHARDYFDMAVKLYKAAICAKNSGHEDRADEYFHWSARALGHVLHLVQDMGSPQHVEPEAHLPFLSHGPSFHEYWALDLWQHVGEYPRGGGPNAALLGGFEAAAQRAAAPTPGSVGAIMAALGHMAHQFPRDIPHSLYSTLTGGDLSRIFWESDLSLHALPGAGILWFSVKQSPPYGSPWARMDRHPYRQLWPADDYVGLGPFSDPSQERIAVTSVDLAERLSAEPDVFSPQGPIRFDRDLKQLITRTTEAAAGAILAFWDEVKDYQCQCGDSWPCVIRADSSPGGRGGDTQRAAARGESCPIPPSKPLPPDNDYPDENHGVVEGAVSISPLENVGAISAHNTISLGAHWQEIARIGVRKGLASLADFGRTMTLLAASDSLAAADEATQDVAFNEMRLLEAKYSAPRTRPEEELNRGAHVALFGTGFAEEAGKLLDALHQPYVEVGVNFDPLQLAEENEVLLVPSGGLQGMAGDARLKARFTAYVAAGGTLIALGQARGEDFQVLPATSELYPQAYGWTQDQSCWREAAVPTARHPAMAQREGHPRSTLGHLLTACASLHALRCC